MEEQKKMSQAAGKFSRGGTVVMEAEQTDALKNKMGVPREPYGFTRNARGTFGPPKFKAARFEYEGGTLELTFEAR